MNIPDTFYLNDGKWNWAAISTISNSFLVFVLVIVTLWYARQVQKQTGFMKKDRIDKEIDKLVKKLYSKTEDDNIFRKEDPYNGIGDDKKYRYEIDKKERYRFWDEIKQNKYLGPEYLRLEIDTYIKNSQYGGGHDGDKAHKAAKTKLLEVTKKRYLELQDELEGKTWIIKKCIEVKTWIIEKCSKVKTKLSLFREKSS